MRSGVRASHDGAVITRELAQNLAAAGLAWEPSSGDRFLVPDRDLDDEVFVVSGMSVEVSDLPTGPVMKFNGTVEWALDSVESDGVVWLPREDQLREMLDDYFLSLDSSAGGFVVTVSGPGSAFHTEPELEASDAYAHAALYVLGVEKPSALSQS